MEGHRFSVVLMKETGRYVINFAEQSGEVINGGNAKSVFLDLCSYIVLVEEPDHFWIVWFSAHPGTDPAAYKINPGQFKTMCHNFNGKKDIAEENDVLYDLYQDLILEAKFPKEKCKTLFSLDDLPECLVNQLKLNQSSADNVVAYLKRNKAE
jgi:hypothetical protein